MIYWAPYRVIEKLKELGWEEELNHMGDGPNQHHPLFEVKQLRQPRPLTDKSKLFYRYLSGSAPDYDGGQRGSIYRRK